MATAYPVYSPASAPGLARFLDADTCKVGLLQTVGIATFGGIVTISLDGSAAAPALTLGATADPNTGLFHPAADTLAISTGGTERLRVDSTGRFGLGTTSPAYKLSIRQESADHKILQINRAASDTAALYMGNDSSNNAIIAVNGDPLALRFGYDSAGTFTERVRFQSDGKVGIGTSAPDYMLHVAKTAAHSEFLVGDKIENDTADGVVRGWFGNTAGASLIKFGQTTTNNFYVGWSYDATPANAYADISTNGSGGNPLVLQNWAGGKVGIGVVPSAMLHIQHATTGDVSQWVLNTNTAGGTWLTFGEASSGGAYGSFGRPGSTSTLGTETFQVPKATLLLAGIQSGSHLLLDAGASDGTIRFFAGGTVLATHERMRITSDGKVGIGTVSPDGSLSIVSALSGGHAIDTKATADGYSNVFCKKDDGGFGTDFGWAGATAGGSGDIRRGRGYWDYFLGEFVVTRHDPVAIANQYVIFCDSTGKVGINTNSPAVTLDVNGDFYVESANGRIFGINGLASGHTVTFRFGDTENVITNTYGGASTLKAFHGLTIQNYLGGTGASGPALIVKGWTGATPRDLQQWQDKDGNIKAVVDPNGNLGLGVASPTAVLHLKAGTASANTAPLKFTSGTLLTAPEAGAIEFLTDTYYGTITTGTERKAFAFAADVVPMTTLTAMQEPTGFYDRAATLSWTDTGPDRTFTITGAHDIYIKGVKYSKTTASIQIADTNGVHFIYYNASGVLSETTDFNTVGFFLPLIASVYWNSTTAKGIVGEERHGITMDGQTHGYLHATVGARYNTGLALSAVTNTTFQVDAGSFYDEDILNAIGSNQTTCDVFYRDGATTWKWQTAQTALWGNSLGGMYYNNGTSLLTVPSDNYCAYWIFASNAVSPAKAVCVVIGQYQDSSLNSVRTNSVYSSLTFGSLPFKEMKLLYRVIYRNVGGTTPTYVESADYRSISNLPSGTYVATSHSSLSDLLVDTHTQYLLLAGRGGQIIIDDITLQGKFSIKTHANFTGSEFVTETAAVQTTTGTAADLWTKSLSADTLYWVEVSVIGRDVSGVDRAYYVRTFYVYRASGNAILGNVINVVSEETSSAWDVTAMVSSETVKVQVTGAGGTTINWAGTVKMQAVSGNT